MIRRLGLFLSLFLLLVFNWTAEKALILGHDDNWNAFIKAEGLTLKKGRFGYNNLVLKDSEYKVDYQTDLLLHFNYLPLVDEANRYVIKQANLKLNQSYAVLGDACAVFQGGTGVVLLPTDSSLFRAKTIPDSFSIEFWLYPSSVGEGETIFSWKGYRLFSGKLYLQQLSCTIRNSVLVWKFENIFGPPHEAPYQFELKGMDRLIPREWHHHLLRYDKNNGMLEYCLDNRPSAVRYSSPTGRDEPTLYLPYLGEAENTSLEIGLRLNGMLDEFRISRSYIENPTLKKYANAYGIALSRVFDLGYTGTVIKRIEASVEKPDATEIKFYLKTANAFNTRENLNGPWKPFLPGTAFKDTVRGRYLQLMIEFFTDGKKEKTPRLAELKIIYEPSLPPVGPSGLKVIAGNGRVKLSWQPVNDEKVEGYYIFYGEAPFHYLGTDAKEGPSPIKVGKATSFELTGLKNGKIYYFAVASYDSSQPPQFSDLLEEKWARPSEALP